MLFIAYFLFIHKIYHLPIKKINSNVEYDVG